jgi:prepilin-type N-terminal cleavage/methylation domain-containing protein
MKRARRGFTLNEMLISLVLLSIIGATFTRILRYQTRYFAHETTLRTARTVARTATNLLLSDLRVVQDSGGVDSVASDGKLIRVLVPYRFGLVCATNGSTTTVSLLPSDSATMAMSVYKGFAFRNATGRYTYVFPTDPTNSSQLPIASSTPASCTGNGNGQAQISSVSVTGRTGDIIDLRGVASGAPAVAPVFLFEKVSYSFKTSAVYPPQLGLWRNVENGRDEELVAPFDTASRFRFYKPGDDTSRVSPPDKAEIRGIDIVLSALSQKAATSATSTNSVRVVTSVFFKNVRAF